MGRLRTKAIALARMLVHELMPLFALVRMDKDRYAGTLLCYQSGEPVVVNVSLDQLESMIVSKDKQRVGLYGDDEARA